MDINTEGPLSKWTNVMNGWQYRWFVLDDSAGVLWYYTSKEKRMRGAHRGCVKLQGAVIGIDDEDDSTFTITVDQKKFYYFQAKDAEEKEKWIFALENTIAHHDPLKQHWNAEQLTDTSCFDVKLTEADAYLKLLIDQTKELDQKIGGCEDDPVCANYAGLKASCEAIIEAVKHSIVLLQISKHLLKEKHEIPTLGVLELAWPAAGSSHNISSLDTVCLPPDDAVSNHVKSTITVPNSGRTNSGSSLCRSVESLVTDAASGKEQHGATLGRSPKDADSLQLGAAALSHRSHSTSMPDLASPTEEFRDVPSSPLGLSPSSSGSKPQTSNAFSDDNQQNRSQSDDESDSNSDNDDFFDAEEGTRDALSCEPRVSPPVIVSKDDYFDELYDYNEEDELESMQSHGSLITHLLSQLRIGMDLTKVVLPTFILEKRSLLEMYADFFAHADLFVGITDQPTPRDRLIQVVRWYLSAFHAGRRSGVAKKPYNPILGETFRCYYNLPTDAAVELEPAVDGPVPWTTRNNLAFIAEQVSHHPPISAFYAECQRKRITLDGYIWTKSKFLGLSIGVHMIGQAVISVLDHEEEYIITFPNGYGRSILTQPWMELGGSISISCPKTGYNATIEFHTKPFYGGKRDLLTAEMYNPNDKKSFCTVKGEWNGIMWAKYAQGMTQNEIFVDTTSMPIIKKQVKPIDQQMEFESRRLWREVTINLKARNVEAATDQKRQLEQLQREEAKKRAETGTSWDTRYFHEVGTHWVYDRPLVKRLQSKATLKISDG